MAKKSESPQKKERILTAAGWKKKNKVFQIKEEKFLTDNAPIPKSKRV